MSPFFPNFPHVCSQGTRYIVMGQIYHRRRHLPNDLLNLLGGKLKPGDGLLRSNNYVKRFNKRRHQKALEATRSRCRWTQHETIWPPAAGKKTLQLMWTDHNQPLSIVQEGRHLAKRNGFTLIWTAMMYHNPCSFFFTQLGVSLIEKTVIFHWCIVCGIKQGCPPQPNLIFSKNWQLHLSSSFIHGGDMNSLKANI